MKRERQARARRKFAMLARLAKRDQDYAENSSPVTIEERNGKITEWRGQRVIGCRAAGYPSHN